MSLVSKDPRFDRFGLLSTKQDIAAAKIYHKYGFEMRDDILDAKSDEGEGIKEKDFPCIEFTASKNKEKLTKLKKVLISNVLK